ncbi:MAG: PRC-barrel domain-containing protein [Nocardioidaceae bacterium]
MTEMTHAYDWRGRTVIGADGSKIGTIDELYTDSDTGAPEWATVSTGLFGTKMSFIPLQGAAPDGESVRVQVSKDQVKDAPPWTRTASSRRRRRRASTTTTT